MRNAPLRGPPNRLADVEALSMLPGLVSAALYLVGEDHALRQGRISRSASALAYDGRRRDVIHLNSRR